MKWGILSTGSFSAKFASTINEMKNEGESIVCVGSQSEERAKNFADKFNIDKYYASYDEVLNNKDVQVVYIASPNIFHYELTKKALLAGKAAIVECPIALTVKEARELYDLAQEKGIFLLEAVWIHFLPAILKMKELILSGAIGNICYVRTEFGFMLPKDRQERYLSEAMGGGALNELGSYSLALIYMIMGKFSEEYFVEAKMNEKGAYQFHLMHFKYPTGAQVISANTIGMNLDRSLVVVGSEGSIYLEDFIKADQLIYKKDNGRTEKMSFELDINGSEYLIREVKRYISWGKIYSSVYTPEMSLDILKEAEKIRKNKN